MSWDYHISELSKKLGRANGILSKLRYNAPKRTCRMVYFSIFHTHLVYGCNVWSLTTEENIQKIDVLQRKCMRILNFAPFDAQTNQMFIDLKIIKVRDIFDLQHLKLAYNYFFNHLPGDIMNLLTRRSENYSSTLTLRSTELNFLSMPKVKTVTYGDKSLRYKCAELWNRFSSSDISVNNDSKKNIKLIKIRNRHYLTKTMKKHYLYQYSLEN